MKRVLFKMIGATALLTLMAGCTTPTTTGTPAQETVLVVPVYRVPKDVAASVNNATGVHSNKPKNCPQTPPYFFDFLGKLRPLSAHGGSGTAMHSGVASETSDSRPKRSIVCCCHPLMGKILNRQYAAVPVACF